MQQQKSVINIDYDNDDPLILQTRICWSF